MCAYLLSLVILIGSFPGAVFKAIISCFRKKTDTTTVRARPIVRNKSKFLPRSCRHSSTLKEASNETISHVDESPSSSNEQVMKNEESLVSSDTETLDANENESMTRDEIELSEKIQLKSILIINRSTYNFEIKVVSIDKSSTTAVTASAKGQESGKKSISKSVSWNELVLVKRWNKKKTSVLALVDAKS
jgi:hypothetical protein